MFLSLGMSADAAASHGHEFSPAARASMEQENPFSHPLQYLQARLQAFTSASSPAPSAPASLAASSVANGVEDGSDDADAADDDDAHKAIDQASQHARSSSESKVPSLPRTSTTYQLARPPPISRKQQRFAVRPRVILQLREIKEHRNPVPALEVLQSTAFTPSLAKRIPRLLHRRLDPEHEELLVLRCTPYSSTHIPERFEESVLDPDEWDHGELLASMSHSSRGDAGQVRAAEILIGMSQRWTIVPMKHGGYDFTMLDQHGHITRARWLPKTAAGKRQEPVLDGEPAERRFKFTLLRPDVRRHPIMAYMDRQAIKVLDQHFIPQSQATSPVVQPALRSSSVVSSVPHSFFDLDDAANKVFSDTSDALRTLILVTGIWVAFAEGWSEVPKSSADTASSTSSASNGSPAKLRTLSGRTVSASATPRPQSLPSPIRDRSRLGTIGTVHRTIEAAIAEASPSAGSIASARPASTPSALPAPTTPPLLAASPLQRAVSAAGDTSRSTILRRRARANTVDNEQAKRASPERPHRPSHLGTVTYPVAPDRRRASFTPRSSTVPAGAGTLPDHHRLSLIASLEQLETQSLHTETSGDSYGRAATNGLGPKLPPLGRRKSRVGRIFGLLGRKASSTAQ